MKNLTWLQAYPQLTPEQLREVTRSTARKDTFTGTLEEGDNNWGYGKADAYNGLKQCISITTLSGHKVLSKALGICSAGATENIQLAGMPRGMYIVSVTTDGGSKAMKFARQ